MREGIIKGDDLGGTQIRDEGLLRLGPPPAEATATIPDSEGLHPIANTDNPDRVADIVFVHGLVGGAYTTWRHGKYPNKDYFFWPAELGKDLPQCGVWSLGYAAGITDWFGDPGMAIQDRARNLVLKLLNQNLGQRPLIFIAHSLGGLEVKEIIVRSQTRGSPEWKHLVSSVRGIVFCGTPHRGAHLASAAKVLANYLSTQEHLQQMEMGAPLLDTLHDEFLTWQRASGVNVESYVEKIGLYRTRRWLRPLPLGQVVTLESGNPGLANCDCHPIAADHITLVKPDGRKSDVYAGVLRFLKRALAPALDDIPQAHVTYLGAPFSGGDTAQCSTELSPATKPGLTQSIVAPPPSDEDTQHHVQQRKRRIDAAAPTHARLGDTIDVLVQVRMANSPPLGAQDFPSPEKPQEVVQDSSGVAITFPVDSHSGLLLPAKLKVRVVAPHFAIQGSQEALLEVPPTRYSEKLVFLLVTRRMGQCRINVELLTLAGEHLRTLPLSTDVNEQPVEAGYSVASLVVEVAGNPQVPAVPVSPLPAGQESKALRTWRERLEFLQEQEAVISDPAQKFVLARQIEETRVKIAELAAALQVSAEPSSAPARMKSRALRAWQEKLVVLQLEEARAADPAQRFFLAKQIEETKVKIAELNAEPRLSTERSSAPVRMGSPVLRAWQEKLVILQHEEARVADPARQFTLHEEITRAKAKIAELEAARNAAENEASPPRTGHIPADISRIVKYAPPELIGREAETGLLSSAWEKSVRGKPNRPRVLTFVALGGEGKTSLVAKWAAELAHQDWPGCDAVFAWSFYSQGTRDQATASSDTFLKDALIFFGDGADKQFAASTAGAWEKGGRLARIIGQKRSLLLLDGLEPLQYAPTSPTPGELKDQGIAALLKGLASHNEGLCLVTTRFSIPDLHGFLGETVRQEKLNCLSLAAGVELLQRLGVKGTPEEIKKLVEDVKGHALTLNLLGSYLRDAYGGDIRRRDRVNLAEANAVEQGGRAFRVMDAYVKALESAEPVEAGTPNLIGQRALAVLRLLGLFDRPATVDCLEALWKAPVIAGLTEPLMDLTEAQRNVALSRLESAKLLTINRDAAGRLLSLDAHPLIREYFAQRLRQQSEAWCAAHRRLYEHLCATTEGGDHPTLEDLQPLYQAVAHGCKAGLQQQACDKVYHDRILRGEECYSSKQLGALGSNLGAVACFFETPWSSVSPALSERAQAWLLNEAAYYLRALGRLTEALDPMRASREMCVQQEDWKEAAIRANNLSELELTLGEVARAVGDAEQSVTYADRSGDAFERLSDRTTHGDALHQAGRRADAGARFCEAEQMQAESQPKYPLMYSMAGFQYCDLLLTEAERAAWQLTFTSDFGLRTSDLVDSCRAVEQRAAQTLQWAKQGLGLLSNALDHLTLGRAALYAAILEGRAGSPQPAVPQHGEDTAPNIATARRELTAAVDGLRRAGQQQHLPRGLLTRAWLRSLIGTRSGLESAQSDLDEAWEIAERGPMPLFQADIHLHRTRLFGVRNAERGVRNEVVAYPWTSAQADLAEARRLIQKHGYLRRMPELEDAEHALLA